MSFGFAYCLAAADRLRRGPERRVRGAHEYRAETTLSSSCEQNFGEHSIAVPAPRLRTTFQAAGLFGGARIGIEATAMA